MLKPINVLCKNNNLSFRQDASKDAPITSVQNKSQNESSPDLQKDTVLKNNVWTNTKIGIEKFQNSFISYPQKGLKGDKNFNFYEFLTTGMFPYVAGSLTLMSVFNIRNKHFDNKSKLFADALGKKMALGVVFYGLAKQMSKCFVTKPVKWATGVDVNMPYLKVVYTQPKFNGDTDIMKNEYHKVFESVEFPRWDLLYQDEKSGKPRNAYYDKIAKKMGLGENLKDSDQEVKPKIKSVVTKTTTVVRLTQYMWAGLGVALAMQKPWENFFKNINLHFYTVNEFVDKNKDMSFFQKLFKTGKNIGVKTFNLGKSFAYTTWKSAKELYNPDSEEKALTKVQKHAGKVFIFAALAANIIGDCIACHVSSKPKKENIRPKAVDESRKYTVS
jgi:hypothetical protein